MSKIRYFLKTYHIPLIYFAIWRLFHCISQIFLYFLLGKPLTLNTLFAPWATNWDGSYYLSIATDGYSHPLFVFFPFFPMCISLLTQLGFPPIFASLLISHIGALGATILLYALTKNLTNIRNATHTVALFLAFPTSFFLIAGYTESTFLAFTIGGFLAIEKQKLLLATLLGLFATSTRITGIIFSITFFFIPKSSFFMKSYMFIGSILGILLFILYQATSYGNPFFFITDQAKWNNQGEFGITTFTKIPAYVAQEIQLSEKKYFLTLDILAVIIGLISTPLIHRRFGLRYSLYVLAITCMYLSSGRLISNSRYILAAFPIFMVIPGLIKNQTIQKISLAMLLLLQVMLTYQFILHRWVA